MDTAIETIQRTSTIGFPGLFGDWTIDPPASFTLFGRSIYFYGVFIALGFLLGITYCAKNSKRFGIREDDVYDLILWLIPLSIVGARLYFIAFKAEYYLAHPGEIVEIWNGGLAIYGGVIAGVIVMLLVCRHKKIPWQAMFDLLIYGLLIGQILGRWGNFMNREAFGAETDIFCRMQLTAPDGSSICVHPTFLYESSGDLGAQGRPPLRRTGRAGLFLLVRSRPRLDRGPAHRQPVYRGDLAARLAAALDRSLPHGAGPADRQRAEKAPAGGAVRQPRRRRRGGRDRE